MTNRRDYNMKKILAVTTCTLLAITLSGISTLADEVYVIHTNTDTPTTLEKIQTSSKRAAKKISRKAKRAASKTSTFIDDKAYDALDATEDAIKSGAQKAGELTTKAGTATKDGAIKATNYTFKQIRNGADKVIQKTETIEDVKKEEE